MIGNNKTKKRIQELHQYDLNDFIELFDSNKIVRYGTIAIIGVVGIYSLGAVSGALAYAIRNINQLNNAIKGSIRR